MSIATEIARLQQAKADLKASIIAKGGTITNETIDEYASKVSALPSPKEEQTKTVSPTTSSQDVLPDANKVLSKVTVNAIPTETKSQQPNLSSGNQTINATSGKFMTSFTITKDTINHIASNIRSGKTLYGVTGNLQPAKEEETKTVTPNFASGNVDVTPTSGKVLSQVTINKDSNLIADNIKSGVTIFGILGTLETAPAKFKVILQKWNSYVDSTYWEYSIDDGATWSLVGNIASTPKELENVATIKFKTKSGSLGTGLYNETTSTTIISNNFSAWTSPNYTLTGDTTFGLMVYVD